MESDARKPNRKIRIIKLKDGLGNVCDIIDCENDFPSDPSLTEVFSTNFVPPSQRRRNSYRDEMNGAPEPTNQGHEQKDLKHSSSKPESGKGEFENGKHVHKVSVHIQCTSKAPKEKSARTEPHGASEQHRSLKRMATSNAHNKPDDQASHARLQAVPVATPRTKAPSATNESCEEDGVAASEDRPGQPASKSQPTHGPNLAQSPETSGGKGPLVGSLPKKDPSHGKVEEPPSGKECSPSFPSHSKRHDKKHETTQRRPSTRSIPSAPVDASRGKASDGVKIKQKRRRSEARIIFESSEYELSLPHWDWSSRKASHSMPLSDVISRIRTISSTTPSYTSERSSSTRSCDISKSTDKVGTTASSKRSLVNDLISKRAASASSGKTTITNDPPPSLPGRAVSSLVKGLKGSNALSSTVPFGIHDEASAAGESKKSPSSAYESDGAVFTKDADEHEERGTVCTIRSEVSKSTVSKLSASTRMATPSMVSSAKHALEAYSREKSAESSSIKMLKPGLATEEKSDVRSSQTSARTSSSNVMSKAMPVVMETIEGEDLEGEEVTYLVTEVTYRRIKSVKDGGSVSIQHVPICEKEKERKQWLEKAVERAPSHSIQTKHDRRADKRVQSTHISIDFQPSSSSSSHAESAATPTPLPDEIRRPASSRSGSKNLATDTSSRSLVQTSRPKEATEQLVSRRPKEGSYKFIPMSPANSLAENAGNYPGVMPPTSLKPAGSESQSQRSRPMGSLRPLPSDSPDMKESLDERNVITVVEWEEDAPSDQPYSGETSRRRRRIERRGEASPHRPTSGNGPVTIKSSTGENKESVSRERAWFHRREPNIPSDKEGYRIQKGPGEHYGTPRKNAPPHLCDKASSNCAHAKTMAPGDGRGEDLPFRIQVQDNGNIYRKEPGYTSHADAQGSKSRRELQLRHRQKDEAHDKLSSDEDRGKGRDSRPTARARTTSIYQRSISKTRSHGSQVATVQTVSDSSSERRKTMNAGGPDLR